MSYQWGTSSAPSFNPRDNAVQIGASKTDTDGTLSLQVTLAQVRIEGDGTVTDQTIADLLGVLVDALKGDGFTSITAGDIGAAFRYLEEVP